MVADGTKLPIRQTICRFSFVGVMSVCGLLRLTESVFALFLFLGVGLALHLRDIRMWRKVDRTYIPYTDPN